MKRKPPPGGFFATNHHSETAFKNPCKTALLRVGLRGSVASLWRGFWKGRVVTKQNKPRLGPSKAAQGVAVERSIFESRVRSWAESPRETLWQLVAGISENRFRDDLAGRLVRRLHASALGGWRQPQNESPIHRCRSTPPHRRYRSRSASLFRSLLARERNRMPISRLLSSKAFACCWSISCAASNIRSMSR
jgi:hypothetical protein